MKNTAYKIGQKVQVSHLGLHEAVITQLPGFSPKFKTQYKITVTEGDWKGNHYVTASAIKKVIDEPAEKTKKVTKKVVVKKIVKSAKTVAKIDTAKSLDAEKIMKLADALRTLSSFGFDVSKMF